MPTTSVATSKMWATTKGAGGASCAPGLTNNHSRTSTSTVRYLNADDDDGRRRASAAPRALRRRVPAASTVVRCWGGRGDGATRLSARRRDPTERWIAPRRRTEAVVVFKRASPPPNSSSAAGREPAPDDDDGDDAANLNPTLTLAPMRGLIAMVEEAGGWVHPALRVGRRGGTEDGARGVFAAAPVPRGVILILPNALRITAGAAGGGKTSLAKALLLRRRARGASAEAAEDEGHAADEGPGRDAFIASLPSDGGSLPVLWTEDEVAALGHPALEAAILRDREAAKAEWVALGDRVEAAAPALTAATDPAPAAAAAADDESGVRGGFTLQEWLWATATVASRTFVVESPRPAPRAARGEGGSGVNSEGRDRRQHNKSKNKKKKTKERERDVAVEAEGKQPRRRRGGVWY